MESQNLFRLMICFAPSSRIPKNGRCEQRLFNIDIQCLFVAMRSKQPSAREPFCVTLNSFTSKLV